jgi:hypothetical protein
MRRAAGLALLLAACSPGASSQPPTNAGHRIDCATGGATTFNHDCTVERVQQGGGTLLVVHHPDGGFRRFKVLEGGNSLAAADGADAVASAEHAEQVDVNVAGDRYRFPAAMLSDDSGR